MTETEDRVRAALRAVADSYPELDEPSSPGRTTGRTRRGLLLRVGGAAAAAAILGAVVVRVTADDDPVVRTEVAADSVSQLVGDTIVTVVARHEDEWCASLNVADEPVGDRACLVADDGGLGVAAVSLDDLGRTIVFGVAGSPDATVTAEVDAVATAEITQTAVAADGELDALIFLMVVDAAEASGFVETVEDGRPVDRAPFSARAARGAAVGEESPYWIADHLPEGFGPVMVDTVAGDRRVSYAAADDPNDVFDAPLRVIASDDEPIAGALGDPPEPIRVRGRDGLLAPLRSDGVDYGVAITWEQRPGLWLRVEGAEPLTRAEVEAVANGLVPVDDAEWDRLTTALSLDTHVGNPDVGADEAEITSGTIGGDTWTLVGLVPDDYPLGPDDRRLTCYRLTFHGESTPDLCDSHPWRLRVGGQVFVFGPASTGSETVRVGPIEGDAFRPIEVATVETAQGQPARFYVLPMPDDTCFVEVTAAAPDPMLGPIGPLPSDPEHGSCLASSGG